MAAITEVVLPIELYLRSSENDLDGPEGIGTFRIGTDHEVVTHRAPGELSGQNGDGGVVPTGVHDPDAVEIEPQGKRPEPGDSWRDA
jgi:hypothetical protein